MLFNNTDRKLFKGCKGFKHSALNDIYYYSYHFDFNLLSCVHVVINHTYCTNSNLFIIENKEEERGSITGRRE